MIKKNIILTIFISSAICLFSNDSIRYEKNISISLNTTQGVSWNSGQNITNNYGYTAVVTVAKSIKDINIYTGIGFYDNIFDEIILYNGFEVFSGGNKHYHSYFIPIGVSYKYGHQKHLVYPLVSFSFNPTFNQPITFDEKIYTDYNKNRLQKFYKNDIKRFTFSLNSKIGIGFNISKLIALEFGGSIWTQLQSISKSTSIKPKLGG